MTEALETGVIPTSQRLPRIAGATRSQEEARKYPLLEALKEYGPNYVLIWDFQTLEL